jgi:(p)ppGpp synthase/HD superfamily hydrolase
MRREGLPVQKIQQAGTLDEVASALNYLDLDALYAAIGENHVSAKSVAERVAKFRFDFELADPNHLDSILWAIKRVESVYAAYRVLPGHAKVGTN